MPKHSPSAHFRTIKILHAAMAFFMALFGAVSYYLVISGSLSSSSDGHEYLLFFPPAIMIVMILSGFVAFNMFIKNKKGDSHTLQRKLEAYQSARVVRNAFFEIPALVAAVVTLMTGKTALLLVLVSALILFYLYRPTAHSMMVDMELSKEEKEELE